MNHNDYSGGERAGGSAPASGPLSAVLLPDVLELNLELLQPLEHLYIGHAF
jgi:hypothetical protein